MDEIVSSPAAKWHAYVFLNAEDAKFTQRTQRNSQKRILVLNFEFSASSANPLRTLRSKIPFSIRGRPQEADQARQGGTLKQGP